MLRLLAIPCVLLFVTGVDGERNDATARRQSRPQPGNRSQRNEQNDIQWVLCLQRDMQWICQGRPTGRV